ncbi:MAG TPA: hypothetical protein VND22_09480 [Actinomycetota bacterium]|nr:hypothetical protein [Actinomycetota bacterium]
MTYTRQPEHWQSDTTGRAIFEKRVKRALKSDGEFELLDSTDSYDEIDFELGCRGRRLYLEVKEKKQSYRSAWVDVGGVPEETLFILDELAARKIVLRGPRAYLLVHDEVRGELYVCGALELVMMPKKRVNRSINGGVATFKGKWLIDLRNCEGVGSLEEAFAYVKRRCSSEDEMWGSLACHGRFVEEAIPRL